jgi:hypothetical protein
MTTYRPLRGIDCSAPPDADPAWHAWHRKPSAPVTVSRPALRAAKSGEPARVSRPHEMHVSSMDDRLALLVG